MPKTFDHVFADFLHVLAKLFDVAENEVVRYAVPVDSCEPVGNTCCNLASGICLCQSDYEPADQETDEDEREISQKPGQERDGFPDASTDSIRKCACDCAA